MMMRMLEAGGLTVHTDGVRRPDIDNPNGYYELEEVKGLAKGETDWLGQAAGRVIKIVSPLLRFLPETHDYRVVMMRRRMDEILASQKVMLEHRGEPTNPISDDELARIYEQDFVRIEGWLNGQPNIESLSVSYNGLLEEPHLEVLRISQFLDADLDLDAMKAIVEPSLYRQRR